MTNKTGPKVARGRPVFKATPRLRRKVSECASVGMSHDDIARAIGCSTPTLQKYFGDELTTGAAMKRAEITAMLFKAARKGNVSAQKHLELKAQTAAAAQAMSDHEAPAKVEKFGKKEQQQAAAARVEGVFAPPEPPKLVVNNS